MGRVELSFAKIGAALLSVTIANVSDLIAPLIAIAVRPCARRGVRSVARLLHSTSTVQPTESRQAARRS